jgi:hypothetical protein
MEEPKDDLPCTYLGCIYVEKPAGMDILRSAIEKVSKTVPEDKWLAVTVNISPASFTITTDNVKNSFDTVNSSIYLFFSRNRKINYSIVVFVIYHFLVLVKIQGE